MSSSESERDEGALHAAAIKRLKSKDPDFYNFLLENEKDLLDFEDPVNEEYVDEDEVDEEEESKTISPEKLQKIKKQIRDAPTVELCKSLISSFRIVVDQSDDSNNNVNLKNNEYFNDIIKLCLIELVPALNKVLNLSSEHKKKDPTESKQWKKVRKAVKLYLIDVLKMISIMKNSSVVIPLLKHLVHLIPFYSAFVKLNRHLLKKVIVLWSSEEETIRVLSLLIIVRATKTLSKDYHHQVLKEMYFAYLKNTKFTSPTTWPMINFMKRSLIEMYSLNIETAYEHAFVYIRQMSIHLRNAITTNKKESFKTVYNWQYIHCILLWSELLCRLIENEPLKTLLYPLVQTTIGVINLIPTAKYIPLRFHLVKALMLISESTKIFIPILPYILDVLKIVDYNKRSTFSLKPVEFSCALKVTKSQLAEAGFKDSCIYEVYSTIVDYLKMYSDSIGFPELALPLVLQFKKFLKECKVSKYNQQLKPILLKVEENSFFISEKRRAVSFSITDYGQVKKWEEDIQSEGTPLMQFKKEVKKEIKIVMDKPPKKKKKLVK